MNKRETGEAGALPSTRGWSPIRALVSLFSNVWVGILWLVLLFIYCSVGSAMSQVRQHPSLELTEFQWFHWWPFNVLILLICTTLVVVTIRRIPFRPVNYGVWTIHVGIIVLCAGSYRYFGTKVEGDTPVFRRRVRIQVPEANGPVDLLGVPGARASVVTPAGRWDFATRSTNSAWPILSDEHKGETAYAVNIMVTPPTGDAFVRQLLANYPQYTEDVIPGKGRAIKSLGRKLVEPDLQMSLEYEPQEYFHLMQSWALYVRRVGDAEWSQRPIRDLPRYNDRVASREQVFFDPGYPLQLRPIDLAVQASSGGDPLSGASVQVTGYLRYAHMDRRWRDGGDRMNPVVRVSLLSDQAEGHTYDLVAFDSVRSVAEDGIVQFRWLDDARQVADLPTDSRPVLKVTIPADGRSFDLTLTKDNVRGRDGEFVAIEGTPFEYRVLNLQDNLVLPTSRRTVSVCMVEIKTPEGTFTRMVADQAEMTKDMHAGTVDPHGSGVRRPAEADQRIVMHYQPLSSPIIIAAHPLGLHIAYNGPEGRVIGKEVDPGDVVGLVAGLSIRIDDYWTRAQPVTKPFIVPKHRRTASAGETHAMIRLEVSTRSGTQTRWLPFHRYVFDNDQYRYGGRFAFSPERFRLDDGSTAEVIFSRERRRLPYPVAMEDFELDTHVGGYTGQVSTIRNYVSRLRFLDNGHWTEPTAISVNAPMGYGGYWYFQSMWDKPSSNDPGGGMNYTGLGVGNRNGVYIQLAGCCIAVSGMGFAFYVKPILKRRRRERSRAWVRDGDEASPRKDEEHEQLEEALQT